jgi:hypothetical protein
MATGFSLFGMVLTLDMKAPSPTLVTDRFLERKFLMGSLYIQSAATGNRD